MDLRGRHQASSPAIARRDGTAAAACVPSRGLPNSRRNLFGGLALIAMVPSAEVSPQPSLPIPDLPPITTARLRLGMSTGDLARAAQIDPAHLDLIERRSDFATPTLDELTRIARVLEL